MYIDIVVHLCDTIIMYQVINILSHKPLCLRAVIQFLQLPVKVEHSGAAMDNASDLLTVVMGLVNVLMAVMRLDVVS